MNLVFKCEYCQQMGTHKEILDHESVCPNNPSVRACTTCGNATGMIKIQCSLGKEIPSMKCIINCPDYVPGGHPEDKILKSFTDIFGDPIGWGKM